MTRTLVATPDPEPIEPVTTFWTATTATWATSWTVQSLSQPHWE